MSIKQRRNSVLRSSLSIKTIQDTAVTFSEGLQKSQNIATDIAKQTNQTNRFKSTLIRKDGEFFRRRREAVRRKDREDELEASSTGGLLKKQGNIIADSTRGFLGRIIDFFAIILGGFFLNTLPAILKKFDILIKIIGKTVQVLRFFTDGIAEILVSLQEGIFAAYGRIRNVEYDSDKREISEKLDSIEGKIKEIEQDTFTATKAFEDPRNIGLKEDAYKAPPEIIIPPDDPSKPPAKTPPPGSKTPSEKVDDSKKKGVEEIKPPGSGATKISLDGVEASSFSPITDEDLRRERQLDEEESDAKNPFDSLLTNFNNLRDNIFRKKDQPTINSEENKEDNIDTNEFDLEPEEGYANIDGMFDGFKETLVDSIDIEGLKKYSEVNVATERKPTSTIIIKPDESGSGSGSGGGLNSSDGGTRITLPPKNNNMMKKVQSVLLNQ